MARAGALQSVAAAGAGLALGWLLWHGGTGDPPGDAETAPTLANESRAPRPAENPTLGGGAPVGGDVRATPVVVAEPDATGPAVFPTIDVEVLDAEGTSLSGGEVYAIPAGTAGHHRTEGVAYTQFDAGRARLVLPRDGTYDVGAVSGVRDALTTDVVVPARAPVVVRLPALARVEVSLDARTLSLLRPPGVVQNAHGVATSVFDHVRVTFEHDDPRPSVQHPGRSDRAGRDNLSLGLGPGAPHPQTALLVAGRRYRVQATGRLPTEVHPSEVVAPGAVQVRTTGWSLALEVQLSPPLQHFDRAVQVAVAFDVDGSRAGENVWTLERDHALITAARNVVVRLTVQTRRGKVAWSGPGIAPGGAEFEIGPDGEAKVPAVIEVVEPPTSPPPAPPTGRATQVRMLPPSDGQRLGEVDVWFASPDGDGSFQTDNQWNEDRQEGSATTREPAVGALASGWGENDDLPTYVAGPVLRPPDGTTFVLRRGGFVVLVPRRLPPSGLQLVVRRADGGLFFAAGDAESEAVAVPGLVLGPFVPGPVRLAFRLGGVDAGEATVQVVAGEHVTLEMGARGAAGD